MNTLTWHEDHELIDDGVDHEQAARDDWASEQVEKEPTTDPCAICGEPCLGPFATIIPPGIPDGIALHRNGQWVYVCEACFDHARESGWRS